MMRPYVAVLDYELPDYPTIASFTEGDEKQTLDKGGASGLSALDHQVYRQQPK